MAEVMHEQTAIPKASFSVEAKAQLLGLPLPLDLVLDQYIFEKDSSAVWAHINQA